MPGVKVQRAREIMFVQVMIQLVCERAARDERDGERQDQGAKTCPESAARVSAQAMNAHHARQHTVTGRRDSIGRARPRFASMIGRIPIREVRTSLSSPRAALGLPVPFDPAVRARQLRDEQVKVIYRHLPVLIAINAVVGAAMVYGLWDMVGRTQLVFWASVMGLVLAARAVLTLVYRRMAIGAPDRWGLVFTVGSAASGIVWGAAGVFLFPDDSLAYQLFVLFVLMGMGAGAITSLTAYMPAFYAFLPVSLLPIGVMLLQRSDPIHFALGVMTFAYTAALSFFGRAINRAFIESLGLRFENIDLVQALSAQRDAAERANVAKSKFLAAASHDLRQPLQSLALFASALEERITYPEVSKIVGNINASVRALEQLFNALLDISRLDAGVLQPAPRHFPLHELCRRLIDEYAHEAEQKGLTLTCAPCAHVVVSDPALLERILRNFLSNALRYTPAGSIRVDCVDKGGSVRIDVVDTGIGIAADQHRAIFNEFYQLDNPERDRTKGLGLGLAIVDRVARLLGHVVDVESTPGRGSRFSIELPRGDLARVVVEPPRPDAALTDLVGMHVLVIDDEVSVREGMRTLLEQWGCVVALAGSADEALAAVRAADAVPQAFIADYRLRDERTGSQALDALRRALGASVPALIITGDTAPERLREARASGYQLAHKPVQPAMLRAFLRNARHGKGPG